MDEKITFEQLKEFQKIIKTSRKISDAADQVADIFETLMDEITKSIPGWAWEWDLEDATDEDINLLLLDTSLEENHGA
jgi:hypothetical protein